MWVTNGWNVGNVPVTSRFVIAEIEGKNDYDGVLAKMDTIPAGMPRAIVTNFDPMIVKDANGVTDIPASAKMAKPLVDAGFVCLPECYLSENPHATPEAMHAVATQQLGFKTTQPCFGTYGGLTVADYAQWTDWPGWSAYLAEYIL